MLLDARSVTALRTGAVAAVAAQALAPAGRAHGRDHRLRTARGVGGALPGRRRLRPRRLLRPARARPRERWRDELGWDVGLARGGAALRRRLLRHPGRRDRRRRRATCSPGLHLNMLGADGPGKAEATIDAVASCALFCDEWEQASHGGELTGAVAGRPDRPRAGDRARRRAGRRATGTAAIRRGDAVRLDRTGDPGPRGRGGRAARRTREGRVAGADGLEL